MKQVVLINQSSGYLMIDIANAYSQKYDKVALVIGGELGESERPLISSISVKRIIDYNKKTAFMRILTWLIAFIQIFFLLLFKYRKYQVVYVTNPPISYLASLVLRMPFSIIDFDTYPDALRNIGIKQGHWLYNLWSRWNRKLFKKANCVYALSNGMADQLTAYVDRSKIKVVSLWPASSSFAPVEKRNNPFVKEHALEDKFVVLYSGNMGYTHSVDVLVKVAEKLKDDSSIAFFFVGDGKKKQSLMEYAEENKLQNCTFLDWQPMEVLPYSLASADLGVVTLNEETALTSVPSKTFNLMAVGAPLLCIAPERSEIAQMVDAYSNGKVFSADKIDEISSFVASLSHDKNLLKQMSDNSLKAAGNYTHDNAVLFTE